MAGKNSRTVYSTDPNWQASEAGSGQVQPHKQGTVYVRRESKGRGGKTVTVISGLVGDLKQWKKDLQKFCGSGGTVKGQNIEIQGDHRAKICTFLKEKGLTCKIAGG